MRSGAPNNSPSRRGFTSISAFDPPDHDPAMKTSKQHGEYLTKRWLWIIVGAVLLVVTLFTVVPKVAGDGLRTMPEQFRLAIIADLDQRSKAENGKRWHSVYRTGTLHRIKAMNGNDETYSLSWDAPVDLLTGHNEAGRGAELSELVRFNGALYTFDDRTGIMFEVLNPERSDIAGDRAPALAPRLIFSEGDGASDKGMKVEWATVKDNQLVVGSFGKEYTDNDGAIMHRNNMWTVSVARDFQRSYSDWTYQYNRMREEMGYLHPSYLLHEAVVWSPYHKLWFVFPRRMSKTPYNEKDDEKRGANTIVTASADFSRVTHTTIGQLTPERGFSSAKFLPGSKDTVIIALKSAEDSANERQTTYVTMYAVDPAQPRDALNAPKWKVIMEETEIPGDIKFEGIEVLTWH